MHKVIFSLPDDIVSRMKSFIPDGERSRIVAKLLEQEIQNRENRLQDLAMQLESNSELRSEMQAIGKEFMDDGLNDL